MGRQMEGDQNRGGKRGRQIFRQKDQRLHTASGGANGDDIAIGHSMPPERNAHSRNRPHARRFPGGVTSKGGANAFTGSRFQPPANQFIRNSRRRSTYCLHHWQQPEPRRRWLRDRRAPAFQAEHTMVQDLTRQNLLEEAELTERHLVQSEVTIAEQRKRVAWQERLGRDSVRSMELLATYLRVRASHIAHHDSLILELGQNTIALKRRSNPRHNTRDSTMRRLESLIARFNSRSMPRT